MKKHLLLIVLLISVCDIMISQTTDANLLVTIHTATQTEIDSYNSTKLSEGMLIYNLDDGQLYRYTGATNGWQAGFSEPQVYTGFFIISNEGLVTVTGIPFEPSQVTFVANANVESTDIDSDNGTGNNDRGIDNSFGTMNGFARNIDGNLIQQVIFGGSHGNSINDVSRYSSSSNCIGIRYGDQNGNSLGKIEGAFTAFTTDGFSINVNYTDGVIEVNNGDPLVDVQPEDVNNESIIVLYTAYK